MPALRELLLNAVVHRDYTSPVDIQIKMFDNVITFFNPGRLFGDLTIAAKRDLITKAKDIELAAKRRKRHKNRV